MLELLGRYILSIDRSHVGHNMRTLPSGRVFGAGIVSLQHLREWELQQYERISVYSVPAQVDIDRRQLSMRV